MSPTSYQAAPPRTTTIADAYASVKPHHTGPMILRFGAEKLPRVVRRVLEGRNFGGIRMNVHHARARLIRAQHHGVILRHPILCSRYRISLFFSKQKTAYEIL